jgi:hypothetical protein
MHTQVCWGISLAPFSFSKLFLPLALPYWASAVIMAEVRAVLLPVGNEQNRRLGSAFPMALPADTCHLAMDSRALRNCPYSS